MNKKCLIIAPLLYDPTKNSRSLDSYFSFDNPDDFCQLYTDCGSPYINICHSYFRLTDRDVLKSYFSHKKVVGTEFQECTKDNQQSKATTLYKIGKRKSYFTRLLRAHLWHKKYWVNNKLNGWLDSEKPDYIFASLTTDTNILELTLYCSYYLQIPVIFTIYDDLLFSKEFNSPFRKSFVKKFKKLLLQLNTKNNKCIYLNDKMQNYYDTLIKCPSEIIHISSSVRELPASNQNYLIAYGSLSHGRAQTLNLFSKNHPELTIHYYGSNYKFKNNNIIHKGFVSYEQLNEEIAKASAVLFLEPLNGKKNIGLSQLSLSTKTSDCIFAKKPIIAVGSKDCYAIEFFGKYTNATVLTNEKEINKFNIGFIQEKFTIKPEIEKTFTYDYSRAKYVEFAGKNLEFVKPLVSVIIPTYNSQKYIKDCLDSVISQTYRNIEIIIADDCSKDETLKIVEQYKDERIKILTSKTNKGPADARNRATELANGKYIAFLDSDDYWALDKLQKQIFFMENNHYDFTYTYFYQTSEDKKQIYYYVTGPEKLNYQKLLKCNPTTTLTVIYNAEKLGKVYCDKSIKKRNDYALWLQLIKKSKYFYCLKQNLAYRRQVRGSISDVSKIKLIKYHYFLFRTQEKYHHFTAWLLAYRNAFYYLIKRIHYFKK